MSALIHLPRFWRGRRGAVAGVGLSLSLAAALSVATLSSPNLAQWLQDGVSDSVQGVKTVAAMLAERSPGERPEGALANLKHGKFSMLADRETPQVPVQPPTAYETLVGPPPTPSVAVPPEAPILGALGATPPIPVTPTTNRGGGPPFLSTIPLPGGAGGGGGGFTPPTIAATPNVPTVPVAPVPEPASWAMMILGFAMMARMMRRRPASACT